MSELHTGVVKTFADKFRDKWRTFGFVIVNGTEYRIYVDLEDGRELDAAGHFTNTKVDVLPLPGDTLIFQIGRNTKGPIASPWAFVTKVAGPREMRPIVHTQTWSIG